MSWSMILFPVWGSFLVPLAVAYYIIAFDVYWLYRSITLAGLALLSHFRIRASETYDWMGDVSGFADWKKVFHAVIIPNYQEPGGTLARTLRSLANQTLPAKQIIPIIAFEQRAGEELNRKREVALRAEFAGIFAKLMFTYHPGDIPGEVAGKSANSAWGARELAAEIEKHKNWNPEMMTVSSADADVVFHPNHFAAVTFKFLDNPARYRRIWQGAVVFYNNIEKIAWPMRVYNRVASVVYMGLLMRPDRLINFSTYTLSWHLLSEIGSWDPDVIPDYIIKQYVLDNKAPFWDKTIRVFKVLEDHFLWPVNWFILTLGATLPPLINENFGRTVIGKTLPQVSSAILTASMVSLLVVIFVDWRSKPKVAGLSIWRRMFSPFEFILLPVVGFFFTALPGLDAHARLMMGRYIEYRTTEKV
ncbi:hypothetical protein HYU91_02140 [Candidatus Collierbacteria bacterium]|nr:hypothetical protein [Candidatus Collierbacteria bacterium]